MTEQEQELALKMQFAKLLISMPNDPFGAAVKLFPNNVQRALRVANEWPKDLEVVSVKDELLQNEDELSFLPTKADACRSIWEKSQNEGLDPSEFKHLMRLYCEVRGFIEKPQANIQVTNNTNTSNIDVKSITNISEAEKIYKEMNMDG